MSEPTQTRDSIATNLNGILAGDKPLNDLVVTQVDIDRFKVLSARNGTVTVHEVTLGDVSPACTCEDMKYNRDQENFEVCAHVAKAALVADSTWDPDRSTMQASLNVLQSAADATERVRELEELVGRLDEANREGHQVKVPDTGASESTSTTAPDDPLGDLKDALNSAGAPVDKLKFEDVNDYIGFAPDGYLDDDEYGAFVEFSQEHDAVEYSPDTEGPDNRIAKKDVPEVA